MPILTLLVATLLSIIVGAGLIDNATFTAPRVCDILAQFC